MNISMQMGSTDFRIHLNLTLMVPLFSLANPGKDDFNQNTEKYVSNVILEIKFYTCASKCIFFCYPFTTHICAYFLMLPRFCSCTLAFWQKFVHARCIFQPVSLYSLIEEVHLIDFVLARNRKNVKYYHKYQVYRA